MVLEGLAREMDISFSFCSGLIRYYCRVKLDARGDAEFSYERNFDELRAQFQENMRIGAMPFREQYLKPKYEWEVGSPVRDSSVKKYRGVDRGRLLMLDLVVQEDSS